MVSKTNRLEYDTILIFPFAETTQAVVSAVTVGTFDWLLALTTAECYRNVLRNWLHVYWLVVSGCETHSREDRPPLTKPLGYSFTLDLPQEAV